EIRGDDVETSVPVQYGLINWTLGLEPMMKPNTRFLSPYLAAVGSLAQLTRDVDLDLAVQKTMKAMPSAEARKTLAAKETLLLRPLRALLEDPHALAGFIGRHQGRLWQIKGDTGQFSVNPVQILSELYRYLHMDFDSAKPASEMIWESDDQLLQKGLSFYREIEERAGFDTWEKIQQLLEPSNSVPIGSLDSDTWADCQAAHAGHQLGLDLLLIIPRIAAQSGFDQIKVDERLEPVFPAQFMDEEIAPGLIRQLAPPPAQSSNEIVTPSGGTFYGREAPHMPLLAEEGMHFEQGQPLFIVEVMKMFNKVLAPFSGTITRNLMADADGAVVAKGQAIFEIEPDEVVVVESEEEIAERRRAVTLGLL
ncbi:acetyl-CoA carboxylase biotin carboxyl carrier protein subunit, partial [Myxococcota bacterium]|nr:acetyl-CoA carboxylase biotin carboxyl carrier protein subunit [Myxococcota bacterium]